MDSFLNSNMTGIGGQKPRRSTWPSVFHDGIWITRERGCRFDIGELSGNFACIPLQPVKYARATSTATCIPVQHVKHVRTTSTAKPSYERAFAGWNFRNWRNYERDILPRYANRRGTNTGFQVRICPRHNCKYPNPSLFTLFTEKFADPEARYRDYPPADAECGTIFDHNLAPFRDEKNGQQGPCPVGKNRNRDSLRNCDCDCDRVRAFYSICCTANVVIKGHSDGLEQAHQIVQYQRTKLCDQAEQLLKEVVSLYDIGTSLGVLVSNHHLRDLLRRTIDGFRSQRHLEAYIRDEDTLKDKEWISYSSFPTSYKRLSFLAVANRLEPPSFI